MCCAFSLAHELWLIRAASCDADHTQAVFDLFFRKSPFGGEYAVFAGLEEVLRFLAAYRFTREHIEYLSLSPFGCLLQCSSLFAGTFVESCLTARSVSLSLSCVSLVLLKGQRRSSGHG